MALKQARRTVKIQTSLGEEAIQCIGMSGEEELSRMFRFQLDLVSMNPSIVAEDIVGKNLTFSIDYFEGGSRFFNGFVKRFAAGDEDDRGRRRYRAEVVPWTWFLTQTSDCRIFQNKNVIDIISQIFRDLKFNDFETGKIKGNHPVREYCVQYRETDFAFVSRLMEEEGIFYFFRHENGKHTLVLADSKDAYEPCLEAEVECPVDTQDSHSHKPHIHTWEHQYEFRTGGTAHTDYNFKTPKTRLQTSEKTLMKFQNAKAYEQYDYPGIYGEKPVGTELVRIRMEELELDHNVVSGTSGCRSFSPGHTFKVSKHRIKSEGGKSWAIRRISHQARELSAYSTSSGGGEEGGFEYVNQFDCFPDATTFRPARVTPRPVMRGCQTAEVTGPKGEEIYPDEHGRVKVQFHWDREGEYDENSSCWIRVTQAHAGKKWGYIDLPRIGEEVIVDFLEGDPDRPIIVGRVYNGQNPPPFDLPAEKTRRGNKTKTYKGDGYNEMSMDDTPGKEQIRVHGQYNMDTVIEHDETHTVHNNRTRQVDVDEKVTIGKDQTNTIGVNRTETVGANETITIGANRTEQVGGNETITVAAMKAETIGAAKALTIGAAYAITVGAAMATTVGAALQVSVGKNSSEDVAKKKTITAGDEIHLVCGDSKIVMKKDGSILIQGKDIVIKGSGKITAKASGDMVLKGSKIGEELMSNALPQQPTIESRDQPLLDAAIECTKVDCSAEIGTEKTRRTTTGSSGSGLIHGLAICRIGGFSGPYPLLDFRYGGTEYTRPAMAVLGNPVELTVGTQVCAAFDQGDIDRPVVLGVLVCDISQQVSGSPGKTLIEDPRQLTLRCGKASINLMADGTVAIRGTNVASRASQTNRIRGGNVQIN